MYPLNFVTRINISTETQDSEEDAVLLAQLQSIPWKDLTIDDARERISQVLLSLHVSDNDNDSAKNSHRVSSTVDKQADSGGVEKSQETEVDDKEKDKEKEGRREKGNRAHTITGWAAVMKQGLGGSAQVALSRNAIK